MTDIIGEDYPFQENLLPNDTMLCWVDSLVLNLSSFDGDILWEDESVDNERVIHTSGQYSLEILAMNGCTYRDTINVEKEEKTTLSQDSIACYNLLTIDGEEYHVGDILIDTIYAGLDCPVEQILNIVSPSIVLDEAFLSSDTTICWTEELTLSIDPDYGLVEWEDMSTDFTRVITESGQYHITVMTEEGCTYQDTINVEITEKITVNRDTSICSGEQLMINEVLLSPGETYRDTILTTECAEEIIYTVIDESVEFDLPLLPADTLLCLSEELRIEIDPIFTSVEWSDGDTAFSKNITESGIFDLIVSTETCVYTDTLVVEVFEDYVIRDTTICEGELLILNGDTIRESEIILDTVLILGNICPSIIETHVTIQLLQEADTLQLELCEGHIEWNDQVITEPGVYLHQNEVLSDCNTRLSVLEVLECQEHEIFVPNILSIDEPFIVGYDIERYDFILDNFQVYDRWGNIIYQQEGELPLGDLLFDISTCCSSIEQGVYVYLLEYHQGNSPFRLYGDFTFIK